MLDSEIYSTITDVLTTPPGLYVVIALGGLLGLALLSYLCSCLANTKILLSCCFSAVRKDNKG